MLSHSAYVDNGHKLNLLTKRNVYFEIVKEKPIDKGNLHF